MRSLCVVARHSINTGRHRLIFYLWSVWVISQSPSKRKSDGYHNVWLASKSAQRDSAQTSICERKCIVHLVHVHKCSPATIGAVTSASSSYHVGSTGRGTSSSSPDSGEKTTDFRAATTSTTASPDSREKTTTSKINYNAKMHVKTSNKKQLI